LSSSQRIRRICHFALRTSPSHTVRCKVISIAVAPFCLTIVHTEEKQLRIECGHMQSNSRQCIAPPGAPFRVPLPVLVAFSSMIGFFLLLCALPSAAAAPIVSVQVDPVSGSDDICNSTLVCRTIAHAVQLVGVTHVLLSPGVFNETTVRITDTPSLVIKGAPAATVFDCSRRPRQTNGAAFNISNSTVTFADIAFQSCSNMNGNGGAVSAVDSSVTVSHCLFVNCSAANGGAVSATARDRSVFLNVQNSDFTRNSAVGGLIACPNESGSSQPCSTWGGSIATFEVYNVTVTGCTMAQSSAVAAVPVDSPQSSLSRNAVAGGGCVSVLFRGNSSGSTVQVSGNSFRQCTVHISSASNALVGNGNLVWRAVFSPAVVADVPAHV
jgi:hypothetical protein